PLTEDILGAATKWLGSNFDSRWGGFGLAPKFPQPMLLEFLLGEHLAGDPDALTMVTTTLDRMAAGGIHDQLGGGFHRYSTDERWLVPHFEKMLYDNAQLARVYLHAFQVTGRDRYREVTVSTLEYLLGEMRHPAGGFFSSQDADSEGEEGRFFVWSQADILAAAQAHGTAVAAYFGTEPQGNWDGTNVLWTPNELAVVAASHSVSLDELKRSVERTRSALIQTRSARVRPSTDDKVLAGWNGLVIIALAEAGRCLGNSDYISAATKACHFVLDQMRDESGKLARSWREGDRGGPAYLDDYALMASACLTLYQTNFEPVWLKAAGQLGHAILDHFADPRGGFFQTADDAEVLLLRPKELFDNAVPAGNSVAADVLLRLGRLCEDAKFERAGVSALRVVRDLMLKVPPAFGYALAALSFYVRPTREIAIIGDPDAAATRQMLRQIQIRYLPQMVVAAAPASDPESTALVPLLNGREKVDGMSTVFLCERYVCKLPITTPQDLSLALGPSPMPD
ncbi:MAG TPA: thioredoxin domain-containing protein, partial [Candidatus Dormibacteraeota bacterium]|nr:thioredoxin domain-containing protein [Candidatus Dormibacteraeota bacterium]